MEKLIQSITYEGGDQLGKGDAVSNMVEYLSQFGLELEVVQFPYYATPIGYLVREMLVNDILDSLGIEKDRELDIRLGLFSLNRLEILNCLEYGDKKDIYLFDRGPYSSPITIAYDMLGRGIANEEYMEKALDKGFKLDKYFLNSLNIDNCIICIKHKDINWEASRGEGEDLYEERAVQELSERVYRLAQERVGEGWKNIETRNSNGWRERKVVCEEAICFVKERGFNLSSKSKNKSEPEYLGINQIQEYMYINTMVSEDLKTEWLHAIRSNNKQEAYSLAKDISRALVETTELVKWHDQDIKIFVRDILEEYPEICYIIENGYGKNFLNKFSESLQ